MFITYVTEQAVEFLKVSNFKAAKNTIMADCNDRPQLLNMRLLEVKHELTNSITGLGMHHTNARFQSLFSNKE